MADCFEPRTPTQVCSEKCKLASESHRIKFFRVLHNMRIEFRGSSRSLLRDRKELANKTMRSRPACRMRPVYIFPDQTLRHTAIKISKTVWKVIPKGMETCTWFYWLSWVYQSFIAMLWIWALKVISKNLCHMNLKSWGNPLLKLILLTQNSYI